MKRFLALAACFAATLAAAAPIPFAESVEFPWNSIPAHLWERDLLLLKSAGFSHLSLPPAKDTAELTRLIAVIRSLNLQADLETPIPPSLDHLAHAHGGPLTDSPAETAVVRVSATAPDAFHRATAAFLTPGRTVLWTDVFDTLAGSTFRAGAVSFTGVERPAALAFHRHALLTRFWGHLGPALTHRSGAAAVVPAPVITVRQYSGAGASFVLASNTGRTVWSGEVRAAYASAKRFIALPSVTIPPQDSLRLPVNISLRDGPLCRGCTGFATADHLVYATSELTGMEYENGILALEFYAPTSGEALLQLHREPQGPLVAGGKLAQFTWDDAAKRLRLTVPAGPAPSRHIRIAIAIDAPDATAFFPDARVLLIGEQNRLIAQYSSEAISQRSRLITGPGLNVLRDSPDASKPLESIFRITPQKTLIDGDLAELAIEADGERLSHAQPRLRRPASLSVADGISVRLAANSSLPLYPTTIPVSQRAGRDVGIVIRNNAPEIRTFRLELKAEGLDFSPVSTEVTVGFAADRTVTFRAFATTSTPGVHWGEVRLSGPATVVEPVRFVVLPQTSSAAWQADGFTFLESLRQRATFLPGRWLEYIGKDNGRDVLPPGGVPFEPGSLSTSGDQMTVAGPLSKSLRLADLEAIVTKSTR